MLFRYKSYLFFFVLCIDYCNFLEGTKSPQIDKRSIDVKLYEIVTNRKGKKAILDFNIRSF